MKIVENKKAPGRQMIKQLSLRSKWILLSIGSVILIVYGIIVLSKAVWLQSTDQPFTRWFLMGGYAMVLLVVGLVLYGNALRLRIRIDTRKEMRRFFRKNRRLFQAKKEGPSRKPEQKQKENPAMKS